jgi:hypothetical protein
VLAVPPDAGNGLPCNRVVDWGSGAIKIHVWSDELDEILFLMQNKRERNDSEGYDYNARRYLKTIGPLADEALQALAQSERSKHLRLLKGCYILGSIAVITGPMSIVGLIVPVALTLLAIECINLRMKQRVADILSFCIGGGQDLKLVSSHPDQPAEPAAKIPAQKGGPHD